VPLRITSLLKTGRKGKGGGRPTGGEKKHRSINLFSRTDKDASLYPLAQGKKENILSL